MNELERDIGVCYARTGMSLEALKELVEKLFNQMQALQKELEDIGAQIGKIVHLSGGVGIGGVLEPLQAGPTIIGDNCFIGARSEIVEGVVVEDGCVISMGVYIGQSTKIFNRMTGEVSFGRIPAGSVVVSGNLPSADGSYSLYCAVIIKQVDERTRSKTGINELLRD